MREWIIENIMLNPDFDFWWTRIGIALGVTIFAFSIVAGGYYAWSDWFRSKQGR